MVVFIQDGEEANERARRRAACKDPEYVKRTHKTVPIVVSLEFHGIKKEEVGGVVKGVCSKFGATTCEAHQNLETPARVELCGERGADSAARALPARQDDRRAHRRRRARSAATRSSSRRARRSSGAGLTAAELKQVRDQFRDAGVKIEKEEWAAALKVAKEAQTRRSKGTPFAKEADAHPRRRSTRTRRSRSSARTPPRSRAMCSSRCGPRGRGREVRGDRFRRRL